MDIVAPIVAELLLRLVDWATVVSQQAHLFVMASAIRRELCRILSYRLHSSDLFAFLAS